MSNHTVHVYLIFVDKVEVKQGHSQNYTKGGSKFSRRLLSRDTDSLSGKTLGPKKTHTIQYDYSHYAVKIKSFSSYMCIVAY